MPLLRRAAPAPALREMFAVGAGWTLATRTALDPILISEGDGSPTSPAAAEVAAAEVAAAEVAVAEVPAAEAAEEAAPTTTITRACLLSVYSCLCV
jgi:hypothetical protein